MIMYINPILHVEHIYNNAIIEFTKSFSTLTIHSSTYIIVIVHAKSIACNIRILVFNKCSSELHLAALIVKGNFVWDSAVEMKC